MPNEKSTGNLGNRRFTYLAMDGTWRKGTILFRAEDGVLVCRLDCQGKDETWLVRPEQVGHAYFLL